MVARVLAGTLRGMEGLPVVVEILIQPQGLRGFRYVGLPAPAVRESKERILGALRSLGLPAPAGQVLVSLHPADLRKEGGALDLAIALGLLAATGAVPAGRLERFLVAGELTPGGEVRALRGGLALALLAARLPEVEGALLPAANAAAAVPYVKPAPVGVASLTEAVAFLCRGARPALRPPSPSSPGPTPQQELAAVRGQEEAKQALVVAAAGGHHLLLVGPPGTGKTLLARRLPALLPPLEGEEALAAALVHSAAGLPPPPPGRPPFRAPHHTASYAGLVGGGRPPRPGEVSLAHGGVLFLDELPEFRRDALEALRECLEAGWVRLVRAGESLRFPAAFQLVAAMNPCPCGYLTHPGRPCRCTPAAVARYRRRVSGALLDRVDLETEVGPVPPEALEGGGDGLTTAAAARRVAAARRRARARNPRGVLNARLSPEETLAAARLTVAAQAFLREAARRLHLSARAYHRTVRVARTLADLAGRDGVTVEDVAAALRWRRRDVTRESACSGT